LGTGSSTQYIWTNSSSGANQAHELRVEDRRGRFANLDRREQHRGHLSAPISYPGGFLVNGPLRKAYALLALLGIDLRKTVRTLQGLPQYFRDLRILKDQQKTSTSTFAFGKLYPCFEDRTAESGTARGQYFHQDLLVAKRIFTGKPKRHVDVASRIDGFIAHLAVFREVEILDIRPLEASLQNIKFVQADLMGELNESLVECCDSLSCLHAVEHFGLGRYGDPLNFDGHLVGLKNLRRILKAGGKFYFSVPIGPQRIEFNGHRIFSMGYLIEIFNNAYQIDSFSYVDDAGDLHENEPLNQAGIDSSFGCNFGLGIFEMTKSMG
jgi:SAM-dependent methyltransferase